MMVPTATRTESMSASEQEIVLPNDEHNRALVSNVHPSNWVNPEPAGRYNMWSSGRGRRD